MKDLQRVGDSTQGSRPVLLLVDDAALLVRSVARALESIGLEVLTAGSAAEARERIATRTVDGALVDFQLGADSGADLLVELRETHARLPLALMSAHELRDVTNLASGLDAAILAKPFRVTALRPLLSKVWAHYLDRTPPLDLLDRVDSLSSRERYSLEEHLLNHRSYEQVAHDLGISRHTVKCYVQRALSKLGFASTLDVREEIRVRHMAELERSAEPPRVPWRWDEPRRDDEP